MRPTLFRATLVLFLLVSTACRYDSTGPGYPGNTGYPMPDGLWTASASPGAVLHLALEKLTGTGDRVPSTTITTPSAGLSDLVGVAFDRDGTMWVTSQDDSRLLAFTQSDLAVSGARVASKTITASAGSLTRPVALAFDEARHLWVANPDNGTVVRFDPAQLAASGAPAPAVVLHVFNHPTALAFDDNGGLWVSDREAQTVTLYPDSELVASGDPNSSIVLHSSAVSGIHNPTGIAFDAGNNLWILNSASNTLIVFSPGRRSLIGSPPPNVTISSANSSLGIPVGLAFDASGDLWVMNGGGVLEKFAKADILATGAPATIARLVVSGHSLFWSVAFWPIPAGLPLH